MNASSAAPRSRDLQSYLGSVMVAVLVILPASIVLLVLSLPVQQAWAGRARKLAQREIEVEPLLTPDSSIEASLNNSSPMASSSVPWTLCSLEGGPGSIRHEEFVSRLDGRKVVFLGDCLLRFQYLELAYYLIHGRCPRQTTEGYILSTQMQQWPDGNRYHEFLKASSRALNVQTRHHNSTEVIFGASVDPAQLPLRSAEYRTFLYQDDKGRRIELLYIFYYTEFYGTFDMALAMAENALPTDVITNFGVWMTDEPPDTTCGDTPSAFPAASKCPNMPSVCSWFTGATDSLGLSNERGRPRDFKLYWAASTPAVNPSTAALQQVIPNGHNLNVPEVCSLPEDQVLNRLAMISRVEPDSSKQPALYNDAYHFSSADVYHAFNWQLLDSLSPLSTSTSAAENLVAETQSSGCMRSMHVPVDVTVAVLVACFLIFSSCQ